MTGDGSKPLEITNRDRNVSAIKAALKLASGNTTEAIVQLWSGKHEEARQRRLDAMIEEVAEMLRERKRRSEAVENEDFVSFFLNAADPIRNATNEDKRGRIRDLLFNSAQVPQGDRGWAESMYCLDQLKQIDDVAAYILAMIVRADREHSRLLVAAHGDAPQWLLIPITESTDSQVGVGPDSTYLDYEYDRVLIEHGISTLRNELKLIETGLLLVSRGGSATNLRPLTLNPAGRLLVKWTVADF